MKTAKKTLSDYFSLTRRYTRSINLERDMKDAEALEGYILTDRAVDALERIIKGLITKSEKTRGWTLTSVYGTGKSAFAHYLISLCAASDNLMHQKAYQIAEQTFKSGSSQLKLIQKLPKTGLFRAVVVGRQEPISNTIIRALFKGAEDYWSPQKRAKLSLFSKLVDLEAKTYKGQVSYQDVISIVKELATYISDDILIVIDELGKNLEFASYNQGVKDLYLLQQLAELPEFKGSHVYLVGLLQQSFSDYGERLATKERNEWAKISGRFEDISFKDSAGQTIRLIEKAIDSSQAKVLKDAINTEAEKWFNTLPGQLPSEVSSSLLASTYPLHPLSLLVLPSLCSRYAQNDRSLFTFLTSDEPFSFKKFLEDTVVTSKELPTFRLEKVYDYFVEAVRLGLTSKPSLQRWVEIINVIEDAKYQDADTVSILKTIGVLNLITTTGELRATRTLVAQALCHTARDSRIEYWQAAINQLLEKGLITCRRQLDELRIWEGSDFNVDLELAGYLEQNRTPLLSLLSTMRPLQPLIAQRHSYQTGTLRYFQCSYIDQTCDLDKLCCSDDSFDGLLCYWVDSVFPQKVPSTTTDGKPLIVLCIAQLELLQSRIQELSALHTLKSAPQLQTDGVARKEVHYRLMLADQLLDEAMEQAFDIATYHNQCWIQGKLITINHIVELNTQLSWVCDQVYHKSPIIWNELINRRELTSQGSKARRKLIEAMLDHADEERLGLIGYGPEVCIYFSLLDHTSIHKKEGDEWGFYPPPSQSPIGSFWNAIEKFCLSAQDQQKTLDKLYKQLQQPPYGIKNALIPVILVAVFIYHTDDLGIYQDGIFIPIFTIRHFELLIKAPERFSVKYFAIMGLRSQVFKELESILRLSGKTTKNIRNATLLTVVKPLFQFIKGLPNYTKQTKRLTPDSLKVLQVLQQAQEPDELLFTSLPQALGLPPIEATPPKNKESQETVKALRKKLAQSLYEIHTAYDQLLTECSQLLYSALAVRSESSQLREDLQVRANYLLGSCLEQNLKAFLTAVVDTKPSKQQWLEALLMIIADKPVQSWTDDDVAKFEIKLSDLARRLKNLEALQKEVAAKGEGFEARRITITRPEGDEINQVVWMDAKQLETLDDLINELLAKSLLQNNPQMQKALVARLTEIVLGEESTHKPSSATPKTRRKEYEPTKS